jgi:hypothetical protein
MQIFLALLLASLSIDDYQLTKYLCHAGFVLRILAAVSGCQIYTHSPPL